MKTGQHTLPRLLALVASFLMVLGVALATPATSAGATNQPVLATYSGEILGAPDADGARHVDIPATIAALKSANINTFYYLVYGYGVANTSAYPVWKPDVHTIAPKVTQAQWEALPEFASAAAAEGIDVSVYLVPPSESGNGYEISTYAPFYWDYPGWGAHIGQVAQDHPNIKAIVIDDFGGNTVEGGSVWSFQFTKGNVAAMRTAARTHAPWLKILPALYYCQFHGNETPESPGIRAISSDYRDVVDGFIGAYNGSPSCTWWSGDGTTVPNTTDPSLAEEHFRLQSSMIKCDRGPGCLELGVAPATPTSTGSGTQVEQRIAVAPGRDHSLSFATNDDWIAEDPAGHHQLQVLVDGEVVWQEDVVGWRGWHTSTVDLNAALAGKSVATLTLRLHEAAGVSDFHVSAWFDSIAATGFTVINPGFNRSLTGWTASKTGELAKAKQVSSLTFVPMAYAARLADVEPDPTTSAYTIEVASAALRLYEEGKSDGVVLYNMNLTGEPNGLGDPETKVAIAELYARYQGQ